jgi:biotin transport system substrate-specific component
MIPGAVAIGWLALVLDRGSKLKASSSSHQALQANPKWQIVRYALAAMAGGIVLVYAIGIPWLALVTKMGLTKACWAMVVFLPGDVLKALVAAVVAQRIRRLNLV